MTENKDLCGGGGGGLSRDIGGVGSSHSWPVRGTGGGGLTAAESRTTEVSIGRGGTGGVSPAGATDEASVGAVSLVEMIQIIEREFPDFRWALMRDVDGTYTAIVSDGSYPGDYLSGPSARNGPTPILALHAAYLDAQQQWKS